jgi:peptidoglycan/xylan/chitin deacetylase (PgdA/CDA1 family)
VHAVKRAFAACLFYSGILPLFVRRSMRGQVVVLMYHRVLGAEDRARTWSQPHIVVSRETFDRHMRALKRLFEPLTLDAFIDRETTGTRGRRPACLVTFDDGWCDTYSEAWPILRRHDVPAVVFLPVNFIGTGRLFWQEQLSRALFRIWEQSRTDSTFAGRARAALEPHGLASILANEPEHVRAAISDVVRGTKERRVEESDRILGEVLALTTAASRADDVDAFMTWDQVREMAAAGIAFGPHGLNHQILTRVPPETARAEIEASTREVTRLLGEPPRAFSYPNGDWNATVAAMVRSTGLPVAFATGKAPFARPHAIRRINIKEQGLDTTPLFLARLAGWF